jgi:hypothetical protein
LRNQVCLKSLNGSSQKYFLYVVFINDILATHYFDPGVISASNFTNLEDNDIIILRPGVFSFSDVNPTQINQKISIIGQNGSLYTTMECLDSCGSWLNINSSIAISGLTFRSDWGYPIFVIGGAENTVVISDIVFVGFGILLTGSTNLCKIVPWSLAYYQRARGNYRKRNSYHKKYNHYQLSLYGLQS